VAVREVHARGRSAGIARIHEAERGVRVFHRLIPGNDHVVAVLRVALRRGVFVPQAQRHSQIGSNLPFILEERADLMATNRAEGSRVLVEEIRKPEQKVGQVCAGTDAEWAVE